MSESKHTATSASSLLTKEQREQVYKLLDDIAEEKLPIDDYTELASHYVLLKARNAELTAALQSILNLAGESNLEFENLFTFAKARAILAANEKESA